MTPPTSDRHVVWVSLDTLEEADRRFHAALRQRDDARFWQGVWFGVALMLAVALVLVLAGGAE